MLDREHFKLLEPKEIALYTKEPFDEVLPRLQKQLPNFPKCVLEQWVYRHFNDFCNDYWWLGFDGFEFELEFWSSEKIYSEVKSNILDTQDFWGDELFVRKNKLRLTTWLAQYFAENKTWPTPIIVLKNNLSLTRPNGQALAEPFHLLEGHMRLAYLRGAFRNKIEGMPKEHPIWVAHCDPSKVTNKW